jgi:hypothetical protein
MIFYRRGSRGPEVKRIQTALQGRGYYRGPLDGDFGGGTEVGVKAFQREDGLSPDGIVGEKTWKALFADEAIPSPGILKESLAYRCLALTGSFETNAPVPDCFAGLSGDFDGQGLSFGALQWNLGQGSLQPMLQEMDRTQSKVLQSVFDGYYPVLTAMLEAKPEEQLAWARSIQDASRFVIDEPWRGLFKTLGRTKEFQDIQVNFTNRLYEDAKVLCKTYQVQSERAVALMFDIKVQNGGISDLVRAQIEQDYARLGSGDRSEDIEVKCLRIIANRRAEAANRRWIADVRTRKLTIANGAGTVHGRHYALEEQFGILLQSAGIK